MPGEDFHLAVHARSQAHQPEVLSLRCRARQLDCTCIDHSSLEVRREAMRQAAHGDLASGVGTAPSSSGRRTSPRG